MTTLHDQLLAAISAREERARAATPAPWFAGVVYPQMVGPDWLVAREDGGGDRSDDEIWMFSTALSHHPAEDAAFIAAEDPSAVLRQTTRDRRVLERHASREFGLHFGALCENCSITEGSDVLRFVEWPCADVFELAEAYGIDLAELAGEGS